MAADPKPRARFVANPRQWAKLRRDLIGSTYAKCAGCGEFFAAARLSLHHLIPRSLGGDDLAQNLVPLCGTGTTGCHGEFETRGKGWLDVAAGIRAWLAARPLAVAYVTEKKGDSFLNRYYPEGGTE